MDVGLLVLLGFVQVFSAIVLGVSLYALTRDEDRDLALLGMACRLAEGIIGAVGITAVLAVLSLATTSGRTRQRPLLPRYSHGYLLREDVALPATFFAVGSTLFCWLLLRGRMLPVSLAWLGVAASVLLVLVLSLRLAGFVADMLAMVVWLPMLVFELVLAVWLIAKGVAPPAQ
jgi:hypothetical protein